MWTKEGCFHKVNLDELLEKGGKTPRQVEMIGIQPKSHDVEVTGILSPLSSCTQEVYFQCWLYQIIIKVLLSISCDL